MSDIIQLLPDSVANQIAAGEVIQRPSSVVKELMENAIDAQATQIQVNITDAGRTAIQVIDNGMGMSDTDARLAFERHATSKIRKATDLFALRTMGFRGEALPSIAAVAQVDLRTRQKDNEIGTHLTIEASKVKSQQPIACLQGCNISVQNLFFNLPARRKFLKSNNTELNHIVQIFQRIVLVYPDIAFTLTHNGVQLYNLPVTTQQERIADIFGKKCRQQLLPVNTQTSLCTISGFVGKPEAARKNNAPQYFFTNGRYMRHPYFHKAVTQVYERLIPQGEQIPYYIYIKVDPANIDVNIHPTKTEIKFDDESAIWKMLSSAVRNTIGRYDTATQLDFDNDDKPDIPVYNPSQTWTPMSVEGAQRQPATPKAPAHWETLFPKNTNPAQADLFPTPPPTEELAHTTTATHHLQYKGRYIVTPVKSGLMLIDQRRAHQRILYEEYLATDAAHKAPIQQLVFVETMELTAEQHITMQHMLPILQQLGFDMLLADDGTLSIRGIPATIAGQHLPTLIAELIDSAQQQGDAAGQLQQLVARQLARQTAITRGEVLTQEEMDNLVNRLFRCTDVHHTPDGKTILHIVPQEDIDRFFG